MAVEAPARKPRHLPSEAPAPAGAPLNELDTLRQRVAKLEEEMEGRDARAKALKKCVDKIEKLASVRQQAEASVEEAKGNLKEAEANEQMAYVELKQVAKGLPVQMPLPLAGKEQEGAPEAGDAWKTVKLSTLGIPAGTVKKLEENEPRIVTLGDLTDWQSKKGDHWVKDLKGIGEAAAEKIAQACDKYWAEHPRPEAKAPEKK